MEKMTLVERWNGTFSHPFKHKSCWQPKTTRWMKTRKRDFFYIPLSLFSFSTVIYRLLSALQHFLLWLKVLDERLASPGVILVLPSRTHTWHVNKNIHKNYTNWQIKYNSTGPFWWQIKGARDLFLKDLSYISLT